MEVLPSGAYRILFPAYLKKTPQQYQTLPEELSTPLGSQLEMSWMDPPFQKDESYFVNSRGRIPLQWSERGPQILARLTPENSDCSSWDGNQENSMESDSRPKTDPESQLASTEIHFRFKQNEDSGFR